MEDKKLREDLIIGRNGVSEALRAGRNIDTVLVAKSDNMGAAGPIIAKCRDKGIPVKEVSRVKLDSMTLHANHQGVVAIAAVREYATVEEILKIAADKGEPPFVIVCDELEDPHNLGAIIRTAEAAGAHGVIIPKRRSASLTFSVSKASAGAVEYVPVARVANLTAAIADLKKKGLWIYGADMDGGVWCQQDLTGPIGLVIGSEGGGLGRLVREQCDGVLSLPMNGKINSLNASVAAGILMYEIARQRGGIQGR